MAKDKSNITKKIFNFVKKYEEMDVGGVTINCSYWTNRLKHGQVEIRGFLDGKGGAVEIRQELIRRVNLVTADYSFSLTPEFLRKFAKRERIGIDCSGFVFHVLDKLIRLKYRGCPVPNLSCVFPLGIKRTNADIFTSRKYCLPIKKISDCHLGDMIRIMGGKHVAIILEVSSSYIVYAHSSQGTKIPGVHFGEIKIINENKSLGQQQWLEETRRGENFGKRYFNPKKGDGVYRLKIFI